MTSAPKESEVRRRNLLKAGLAGSVVVGLEASGSGASAKPPPSIAIESGKVRHWIGPEFWSNRFQDWRLNDGVIECLNGDEGFELRTLGLLTRDLKPGVSAARLSGRFLPLTDHEKKGFAGFLIGVGGGALDYRCAALAQRGGGAHGGFMAVVDTNGIVSFRDHTDESGDTLIYETWSATEDDNVSAAFLENSVDLVLEIRPAEDGFDVLLTALAPQTKQVLSYARKTGLSDAQFVGGISILSSPPVGAAGARWAISDLAFSGDKMGYYPERALGPVMASLYSLSDHILKMTVQFMPLGDGDPKRIRLQTRKPGTAQWRTRAEAKISDGFSALFRVEQWDDEGDWEYRIVFNGEEETLWSGTIGKDPKDSRDISAALYSCISSTAQSLEGGRRALLPQEAPFGLFSPANFYFPHNAMCANTLAHDPDILFVCGDQYYEHNPIRFAGDTPHREIDTLYRWYLWLWSFRELTRDRPTIVLIDDHDVLHGNIWGQGGIDSPEGNQNRGGYKRGADLVKMVHRVQTGHNPDPYDATPILNGIPVSYGEFFYGGVSFAVIEDRKWKTAPQQGSNFDVHVAELLGKRQEMFLKAWRDMRPGAPKVLVTQSIWACLQTAPDGAPMLDFDSNGYPPLARRRAVSLVKDAGAVMIAGDQHLASAIRHGIDAHDDGPVQFCGPAGAAYWQRWFDTLKPLENARDGVKESGDFIDAFGNKMNVLAVANPKISFADYRKHRPGVAQFALDPSIKSEGYGIIRISHAEREFEFECWPTDEDPLAPDAKQYAGWPLKIRFEDA